MMKGIFKVRIVSKKVIYDFEIRRKITVIRGNSGTGKTTLVELVTKSEDKGMGVQVIAKVQCVTIVNMRNTWKTQIENLSNTIIFIDETAEFVLTTEFARVVAKSDNYFVLVTRSKLDHLSYSVHEIYEISTSGKYHTLEHIYNHSSREFSPDVMITEDSGSGYQFFLAVCKSNTDRCLSAAGKSNIKNKLREVMLKHKNILIVADGAAFGSDIENVLAASKYNSDYAVCVYLPESFEYMLLKSEIFKANKQLQKILADPYEHIDTRYISWERYFTALITKVTDRTPAIYSKTKISECYVKNCCTKAVPCQFMVKGTGENQGVNKIDLIIKDIGYIDFSKLQQ